MRKSYQLENLDCAHCAAKMEHDINAFDDVTKCTITFMTARMSLSVPDGTDLESVLDRAQKVIHSYEKDCDIVR